MGSRLRDAISEDYTFGKPFAARVGLARFLIFDVGECWRLFLAFRPQPLLPPMNYFVIEPEGQKYGPANIESLNLWLFEERISALTLLEDETGNRVRALAVPGLRLTVAERNPMPVGMQMTEHVVTEPIYKHPAASQFAEFTHGAMWGDELPVDYARRFNWGALAFTWVWGMSHRSTITIVALLVFVLSLFFPPLLLVGLGIGVWFGTQGNEWAWQSGRFGTPDEMLTCQRVWARWACGLFLASIAIAGYSYLILGQRSNLR